MSQPCTVSSHQCLILQLSAVWPIRKTSKAFKKKLQKLSYQKRNGRKSIGNHVIFPYRKYSNGNREILPTSGMLGKIAIVGWWKFLAHVPSGIDKFTSSESQCAKDWGEWGVKRMQGQEFLAVQMYSMDGILPAVAETGGNVWAIFISFVIFEAGGIFSLSLNMSQGKK